MPGYFLGSSAIGKIYHVEIGTPVIQALVNQADSALFISRLAVIEVPSAFVGKVRTGHLTVDDIELLRARFRGDLRRKVLRTVAMKAGHFRDAERLINIHSVHSRLRTLDAVQLAVAIQLQNRGLVEIFVCADKALCRVAESVGFAVLNPETASQR
ncbi:MAG: type II toxin-antitoxin system VapC family toxin [Bryobacteraceae bacterium]